MEHGHIYSDLSCAVADPTSHIIGRRSCSGNEFFPYTLPTGPPVCIETQFDIGHTLFECNATQMANEDAGVESEDEREVEALSCINSEDETNIETPSLPYHFASPFPTPNPLTNVLQLMPPSVASGTPANTLLELTRKQQYVKESRA